MLRKRILFMISLLLAISWSISSIVYMFLMTVSDEPLPTTLKLPTYFTLSNYHSVIFVDNFFKFLFNSLIIGAAVILLVLFVALSGGYAISRFNFKGKDFIYYSLVAFRMVPWYTLLVPFFLVMSDTGLMDTYLGLILVYFFWNLPFSIILMRPFFDEFPIQIEEAALLDGASRTRVLFNIVLPVCAPALGVVLMFVFLSTYIEFLYALIITRVNVTTIPVMLSWYVGAHRVYWKSLLSSGILSILPILPVFYFLQKYVARVLTFGAAR